MDNSKTPVAEKTLWRTPRELIEAVEDRFGGLSLDAAATDEYVSVAPHHISPDDNALGVHPWTAFCPHAPKRTLVWLNSPWGRQVTERWVDRAIQEIAHPDNRKTRPRAILLLTPHSDASWWWRAAEHSSETLHLGRVAFLRPNGEQCGSARDWHDLHVLRPGVFHPGQAVLSRWDWR